MRVSNPAIPFGDSLLMADAPFNRYGFEHHSNGIRMVSFAGSIGACWGTVSDDSMCIISNNLVRVFIEETTGDVGIHQFDPQFTLHVNGTAGKPGGGPWSVASDLRLKRNVASLEGTLDKLLRLRGVTFEYKDPDAISERPGRQVGMIAQEVEQVFPDWVDEAKDGYKRLTPRGFEALTIEALRDLRTEKDREIDDLWTENERLSERVAQLEHLVRQLIAEH